MWRGRGRGLGRGRDCDVVTKINAERVIIRVCVFAAFLPLSLLRRRVPSSERCDCVRSQCCVCARVHRVLVPGTDCSAANPSGGLNC